MPKTPDFARRAASNPMPGHTVEQTLDHLRGVAATYTMLRDQDPINADNLSAVLASLISSNNWCWMLEQFGRTDDAVILHDMVEIGNVTAKAKRRRFRYRAAGSDNIAIRKVEQLHFMLYLLNPLNMSTVKTYALMHPNNDPSETVGLLNFRTPMLSTMIRERQLITKANKARVKYYDPTTKKLRDISSRTGKGMLPPIEYATGHYYWQTEECRAANHNVSPFYIFHALAWAKRSYARLLINGNITQCPLLGHNSMMGLTVPSLLEYNDPALPHKHIRYLIEADLHLQDKSYNTTDRKHSKAKEIISLPYYIDLYNVATPIDAIIANVDDGMKVGTNSPIPKDQRLAIARIERYAEPQRANTTLRMFETIIRDEKERIGLRADELLPELTPARPTMDAETIYDRLSNNTLLDEPHDPFDELPD